MNDDKHPSGLNNYVGYDKIREALGYAPRTIQDMVRRGEFPQPVRLPGRVGGPAAFRVSEVNAWDEARQTHRRTHLQALAVSDPDKLAPDQVAPTMRELGARLVADHIGESVSPEQITLSIERSPTSSDAALSRGHLLQQVEELCEHFDYSRALMVAASLFPALRDRLAQETNREIDPERLRKLAIASLDDEWWAEFDRAGQRTGAEAEGVAD